MEKQSRKEAVREYKERKLDRGIFVVRCRATGAAWVGATPNLGAARNGLWFGLGTGAHIERELQAEWNAQGEAAFEFEILERLDPEINPLSVKDVMKEKRAEWATKLGARMLR